METSIYNVVTYPHSDKQNVDHNETSPPKFNSYNYSEILLKSIGLQRTAMSFTKHFLR